MSPQQHRLQTIEQARNQVLQNQAPTSHSIQNPKELIAPWVLRSWQRCLQQELRPNHKPFFNPVSQAQIKRIQADNHHLIQAAMPVLESLSHTLVVGFAQLISTILFEPSLKNEVKYIGG